MQFLRPFEFVTNSGHHCPKRGAGTILPHLFVEREPSNCSSEHGLLWSATAPRSRCGLCLRTRCQCQFRLLSSGNVKLVHNCVPSVIRFDELMKMRSHAGVDGALERECVFVTFDRAEATARGDVPAKGTAVCLLRRKTTARVDVPTAPREFCLHCSFGQFHGPS